MTDPHSTTESAAPQTTDTAAAGAGLARNTIGLVGLGLAILGAVLAIVPATNGFSWLVLLAAFVLGIVGVTRKSQRKLTSVLAMAISFLFWIISIVVGVGLVASGISTAISDQDDAPAISQPSDDSSSDTATAEDAGLGDTVTTDSGAEVTFVSIDYAVANPNDILISEVRGALVAVHMTMTNNTDEAISISGSSVLGYIGSAEYEAAAILGDGGSWYVYEEINPGLTASFTAYIDVPASAELDSVKFTTAIFFGEDAVFVAK